ncbi:DNA ligase 1, partial [Ananas comosus]
MFLLRPPVALLLSLKCSPPPPPPLPSSSSSSSSILSLPFLYPKTLNPNPLPLLLLSCSCSCSSSSSASPRRRRRRSAADSAMSSSSSGKRSVADVLMGAARAAAEKKAKKSSQPRPQPQEPSPHSPKKPKTLVPQPDDGKDQKAPEERNPIVELKKKGQDFDPKAAASWKPGDPVPFLFLARGLELISNESGRIAITEILSNVFRTVMATTPGDLLPTVYLSANRIAPPHEGIELGIGDASLIKALAEAYGRKEEQVKKQHKDDIVLFQWQELGDLGLVAKESRSSQKVMFKPKPLTISKVLDIFRAIAKESGKDSQDKKRNHIKGLLVAATDCEPQYLIRLLQYIDLLHLQSKMRIGLAEKTVLVALGQAAVYSDACPAPPVKIQSPLEEAAKIIKQVYSVLPDYDKIVPALLQEVGPMLAKPTKAVSEILDKFQGLEFTCEYKYDGERAQIHYMEDGSVEIYSRNAERNTGKYPDVVNAVSRFKKATVKSFVLDCEIVAFDREKKKILPFQVLSTRARKGVVISDIKVAVCTFGFDILYINGQPLLQEQLKVRREHLYNSFEEVPGVFQFATAITSNDLEEIQKFLETAVNS